MSARGVFVTFEGIEGSGKTTQMRRLSAHLSESGVPHITTREPGGTPLADQVRTLLLSPRDETVFPETELLLYEAARAQHVRGLLIPALNAGKAVLCDRFFDATFAYQAYARGLGAEAVRTFDRFASGDLVPDLTLLFDLPPETGISRATRRAAADRIEKESLDFHRAVRNGYLALLEESAGRIVLIDASATQEIVFARLMETVRERFGW